MSGKLILSSTRYRITIVSCYIGVTGERKCSGQTKLEELQRTDF